MSEQIEQGGASLNDELEAQALASLSAKIDDNGGAEAQAEAEPEAPKESALEQWAAVYETFGELAGVRFPSLRKVYSRERCIDVQTRLNPIFERHGWNNIEAMRTAMQYLMGAVAVVMLGKDTAEAIRHDLEKEASEAAKEVRPDGK